MHLRRLALLLCLSFPVALAGCARETPAEHAANVYAGNELAASPLHGNLPDYSLPPDKLAKAQHLETIRTTLHFGGMVWGILQAVLLLWLGGIAWMRDRAVRAGEKRPLQRIGYFYALISAWLYPVGGLLFALTSHMPKLVACCVLLLGVSAVITWKRKTLIRGERWVQAYTFLLLFIVAGFLLDLPLSLYGQHLRRAYGLSIQSWASWFGDQGKSLALGWLFGGLFLMLLFLVIRKFPRRWWVWGWGVATAFLLIAIFITPYVIDPLFNKFEPLQKTHPELVTRLEQVVAKGHMDIPPERMFLMKASEKVTTINAYVTGFGASKRVVVWDTSLTKGTPDQVLFIFGHESGHYVLGHVLRGIFIGILGLLISFYLGFLLVRWAIARFGPRWRIPSQEDWGAFAVLLLAFSLFSTVTEPISNAISRNQEHAADVYGQEAVHRLVADPQETVRSTFGVLAENSFEVPNPSLFMEFWTDNHPASGRRAAFGKAYDPWAPGVEPKYFQKQ